MRIDVKKNFSKIATVVLVGMLMLLALTPNKNEKAGSPSDTLKGSGTENELEAYAGYYEDKLTELLENSYGEGNIRVMVNVQEKKEEDFYSGTKSRVIDGVLIVARVSQEKKADIVYAVSGLFNLPTHKVAVIVPAS